jgi:hypothetical protein
VNTFDPLKAGVEQYLRELPDDQWDDLTSRVRLQRPATFSEKAGQLWDLTQQCVDGNGYTRGMSDAMAARDQQPQPPEPVAPQQPPGFAPNRAQAASGGSDWAPINDRDLNRQKIADIRAQKGL